MPKRPLNWYQRCVRDNIKDMPGKTQKSKFSQVVKFCKKKKD